MPRIHRNTPDTEAPMIAGDRVQFRGVVLDLPGQGLDADREQERQREDDRRVAQGEPEADRQRLAAGSPSAMSLRVVLSTAAMWSASKACRSPNV